MLRSAELPIHKQVDILLNEWILKCGPPQAALKKVGSKNSRTLEWFWSHRLLQAEWEDYVKKWGEIDRNILETFYIVQKVKDGIDNHHRRKLSKEALFIDEKLFDEVHIRKLRKKNVAKYEEDYERAVDNLKKRKAEEQDDIREESLEGANVGKRARVDENDRTFRKDTNAKATIESTPVFTGGPFKASQSTFLKSALRKPTLDISNIEEPSPSKKSRANNPPAVADVPMFTAAPATLETSSLKKRNSDHFDVEETSPSKKPRANNPPSVAEGPVNAPTQSASQTLSLKKSTSDHLDTRETSPSKKARAADASATHLRSRTSQLFASIANGLDEPASTMASIAKEAKEDQSSQEPEVLEGTY